MRYRSQRSPTTCERDVSTSSYVGERADRSAYLSARETTNGDNHLGCVPSAYRMPSSCCSRAEKKRLRQQRRACEVAGTAKKRANPNNDAWAVFRERRLNIFSRPLNLVKAFIDIRVLGTPVEVEFTKTWLLKQSLNGPISKGSATTVHDNPAPRAASAPAARANAQMSPQTASTATQQRLHRRARRLRQASMFNHNSANLRKALRGAVGAPARSR